MNKNNPSPENIIANWCNLMSRSVTRRDIDEHMSQISEKLHVYGIPGHQQLKFIDWEKRRRYEFKHDMLATITYKLLRIKTITSRRITFRCEETMHSTSEQVIIIDKDITLEFSDQLQHWQSVEEDIHDWQITEQ